MYDVFETVIQRDLERIPMLEALHIEHFNDQDYLISQIVLKNIFTDFDGMLSRHLAATRGEGFPRFTVMTRFREEHEGANWKAFEPTHHVSVPHALRALAERAVSFGNGSGIAIRHAGRADEGTDEGNKVQLEREDINALSDALAVCETIGEPEFMEISGDFDLVLLRPSKEQKPVTMYLRKGSVSMPSDRTQPFECPIAGFRRYMRDDIGAQSYVAAARHQLSIEKERAVSEFRLAAERQILDFDRALGGQPLEGHRFESAQALIQRLRAGLGDELRGLTEAARVTALDWSLSIENADTGSTLGPRIAVASGG